MADLRVALASTGRADFSSCAALWRAFTEGPGVDPTLWVLGDVGRVRDEATSLCGRDAVRLVDASCDIAGCAARWLDASTPDLAVIVGDRWELLPLCTAMVVARVPMLHLSGGELTFGALDEQVRHAVTKMAHLHAVAHESFRARLLRMGEEPWRVTVTGDVGLDAVATESSASVDELSRLLGAPVGRDTVVVAMHPETAASTDETARLWASVAQCLDAHPGLVVVTAPNRDPGADALAEAQRAWCDAAPSRRRWRDHLGSRAFQGLLRHGGCLVGNSSAGIWEAPTLGAPAVNVGRRQEGRLRGANVIDVTEGAVPVLRAAVAQALRPDARRALEATVNPYGDGHAAPRVAEMVRALPPRARLLTKRFHDEACAWTASC